MTALQIPSVRLGRPRLSLRHGWVVPGLAIAVYANTLAGQHGIGLLMILAFGIVPHLPVVLGVGQPHAPGQMPGRAVPLFNLMHHPLLPLAVVALAAAGILSSLWLVGGLVWFSHIVMDLAFGQGLRTADGWRRPPWGVAR
jgi:Domain of unknown function (DUF4260)